MEAQLAKVLGRAAAHAGAQLGNIQMMDWRRGELVIKSSLGFDARFLETFRSVSLTEPTVCARAAMQRRPVLVQNVFADRDYAPLHDIARHAGFHSVLSTPMIARSRVFVGVLSLHFAEGNCPDAAVIAETGHFAQAAADDMLGYPDLREQTLPAG
jgi:GAF domain-containing protein